MRNDELLRKMEEERRKLNALDEKAMEQSKYTKAIRPEQAR